MANARTGNVFYVDSTGELTTDSSVRLLGIIFTTNSTGDLIELSESVSGPTKIYFKHKDANNTHLLDLSGCPVLFSRGIYVKTLSASAKATLITSTGGGN